MFDPLEELKLQDRGRRFIAGLARTYVGGEPVFEADGSPMLDGDKVPVVRVAGDRVHDEAGRPVYERSIALWYRPTDGNTSYRVELAKRLDEEKSRRRAEILASLSPEDREVALSGDDNAVTRDVFVRSVVPPAVSEEIERGMAATHFLTGWDDGDEDREGKFVSARDQPETAQAYVNIDWVWQALRERIYLGAAAASYRLAGDLLAARDAKKKRGSGSLGKSSGGSPSARGGNRPTTSTPSGGRRH